MEDINKRIDDIDNKLSLLLAEMEIQQRKRQEFEELKEDLMRVSKDLYSTAVYELEEVHDYMKTGDIIFLLKKVLRNINNLSGAFDQMESVRDFITDAAPISREVILDTMKKLDELDKKGYFTFIKNMSIVTDKIITELPKDRILEFTDQIPKMLYLIEILTDNNLLDKLVKMAEAIKNNVEEKEINVSTGKLLKEFTNKETKQSLFKLLQIVKSF
jgi:tetrahydromethanopterin S-methyltransferase subunit G